MYTGYGDRQMLGLTSAGLAQCGGSCPLTTALLTLQDQRTDMTVVLGSAVLDSAAFASRLISSFAEQQACVANGQCPYEAHVLDIELQTPQSCGNLDTFLVSAPGGGNLINPANLENALYWTTDNGPNPLINFQSTASTVRIDPSGVLNPLGDPQQLQPVCSFSSPDVNLTGSPCVCTTTGVTSGMLVNDRILTPHTYYCRSIWGCSQSSSTDIAGESCTCPAQGVFNDGVMRNDRILTPHTYYCRHSLDHCQVVATADLNGASCSCAARSVTGGQLSNSGSQDPNTYYCQ